MYFNAGLAIECVKSMTNRRHPKAFEVQKFPRKFSWYKNISK
jgi:hypothetical protein